MKSFPAFVVFRALVGRAHRPTSTLDASDSVVDWSIDWQWLAYRSVFSWLMVKCVLACFFFLHILHWRLKIFAANIRMWIPIYLYTGIWKNFLWFSSDFLKLIIVSFRLWHLTSTRSSQKFFKNCNWVKAMHWRKKNCKPYCLELVDEGWVVRWLVWCAP